jgi:hypothetical protein
MASTWIDHVKMYAKEHNMKYGDAMKDSKCKMSYKKKSATKKNKM